MRIDFEEIFRNLDAKANTIFGDTENLQELLEKVKKTVQENKELNELWSDIKILIELIKDWMKGEYTNLSQSTIIIVIVGFLYLVSPIDLIPDFLPGGFLDDILVLIYILKKISGELDSYKEWREARARKGEYPEIHVIEDKSDDDM